jgi:uncharacterized protein DUF3846
MADTNVQGAESAVSAAIAAPLNTLVIIQPDGTETRETYEGNEPELKQLQRAVGGLIELVQVEFEGTNRVAFINEEGKHKRLEHNRRATEMWGYDHDVLVGPIVILVPATLTVEQKVERARSALARARGQIGEDLAGYSVTDYLADNFTSWTLAECDEVAKKLVVQS